MDTDIQETKALNAALARTNGFYQKWTQKHNVSHYLLDTLYALYKGPAMTQKQICEVSAIPKQTVNSVIQSLKKQGYVELITDEADKRGKKVILTDSGEEYAKEIVTPLLQFDGKVKQRLGEERFSTLVQLLVFYGDAMEKELELEED